MFSVNVKRKCKKDTDLVSIVKFLSRFQDSHDDSENNHKKPFFVITRYRLYPRWGALTTLFIVLPWLTSIGVAFYGRNGQFGKRHLTFAFFNALPLAPIHDAWRNRDNPSLGNTDIWRMNIMKYRVIEVALEAFPQVG